MKKICSMILLGIFSLSAKHPQGDCDLVKKYYPDLGREFAKFLIEKNEDNDKNYWKKMGHYLEEIDRWNLEYRKCIIFQNTSTDAISP